MRHCKWEEKERNEQIVLRVINGEQLNEVARAYGVSTPRIENVVCHVIRQKINEERAQYMSAKRLAEEYGERLKQLLLRNQINLVVEEPVVK